MVDYIPVDEHIDLNSIKNSNAFDIVGHSNRTNRLIGSESIKRKNNTEWVMVSSIDNTEKILSNGGVINRINDYLDDIADGTYLDRDVYMQVFEIVDDNSMHGHKTAPRKKSTFPRLNVRSMF